MTQSAGESRAPANPLLAAVRFACFVLICLWSLAMLPWRRRPGGDEPARLARLADHTHVACRLACRAFGYRVNIRGQLPSAPCLLAPNHLGYADIIAMAGVIPCFFLSKSEVASWPLVGWCTSLYRHLFVSRVRGKRALLDAGSMVEARLRLGQRLCIFLEGTSSGGDEVLPFKPSFIQPVVAAGVPIVPVALRWHSADPRLRVSEDIAYWKDHVFVPHFWRHLGLRHKAVDVVFGTPIATAGRDRQALADEARDAVVALLRTPTPPG